MLLATRVLVRYKWLHSFSIFIFQKPLRRPNIAVNSAEIESKKAINSCMQCSVKENNALCIVQLGLSLSRDGIYIWSRIGWLIEQLCILQFADTCISIVCLKLRFHLFFTIFTQNYTYLSKKYNWIRWNGKNPRCLHWHLIYFHLEKIKQIHIPYVIIIQRSLGTPRTIFKRNHPGTFTCNAKSPYTFVEFNDFFKVLNDLRLNPVLSMYKKNCGARISFDGEPSILLY